jgi:DNA oxidative demethylase
VKEQQMETTQSAPPGFKFAHEVMTGAEEQALIDLIEASGLSQSHFTYEPDNRRSTMSYIYKYDMPSQRFVPGPPMPQGFHAIADRAATFAGLAFEDIAHCALNGYQPGSMIQSHLDMPCWERVVGISLGSAATLNLRKGGPDGEHVLPIALPPRSMYLLQDEARHIWEHGIPPVEQKRWSITFRWFTAEGMLDSYPTSASRGYS